MRAAEVAAALVAGFVCAGPAGGQVIRGRVVDAGTLHPIAGAAVQALPADSAGAAATDDDGAFELRLPRAGSYRLRAGRPGYVPVTSARVEVFSHEAVEVELRLAAAAIAIRPLVVRARVEQRVEHLEANGFYRRRELGVGRFVTRREIERQRPRTVSEVLRRFPGVQVVADRRGRLHVVFARGAAPCSPRVAIDGMLLGDRTAMPVDDLVQPVHVEAVEIYRGASEIPALYRSHDNPCGVLVFWTRAGESRPAEDGGEPPPSKEPGS